MEILDVAARIVVRFHSHCPQTAQMYYHPPVADNHHHQTENSFTGRPGSCAASKGANNNNVGTNFREFVFRSSV
ncbi:hypothetical protein LINGRAHAP2_LOCUS30224 [Linum grandiflorum]